MSSKRKAHPRPIDTTPRRDPSCWELTAQASSFHRSMPEERARYGFTCSAPTRLRLRYIRRSITSYTYTLPSISISSITLLLSTLHHRNTHTCREVEYDVALRGLSYQQSIRERAL